MYIHVRVDTRTYTVYEYIHALYMLVKASCGYFYIHVHVHVHVAHYISSVHLLCLMKLLALHSGKAFEHFVCVEPMLLDFYYLVYI